MEKRLRWKPFFSKVPEKELLKRTPPGIFSREFPNVLEQFFLIEHIRVPSIATQFTKKKKKKKERRRLQTHTINNSNMLFTDRGRSYCHMSPKTMDH